MLPSILHLHIIHLVIHTGFAVFIILFLMGAKQKVLELSNWMNASIFWTIVISFFVLDFFGGWLVHLVQHKTRVLMEVSYHPPFR